MFTSILWQTFEILKLSVNYQIIEATQFLLWHEIKYVLTEHFCEDPLENWFGRQRSLGSRKDNPSIASMTGFGHSDSPIRKQTNFKPVVNGNFADSSMIALTNKPLPCWKPKKEWKFKRKYWIKKSSN